MDQAGIHGMWAVMLFSVLSFVLISPYVIYRWRDFFPGRLRLQLGTTLAGFAWVLYVGAFLYTEVVRVLVLFYLMPIWGFVFARIFIGDAITPVRWLSLFFGLLGLVVICGIENGIPLPSNSGDWMALVAGVIWAGVSLSILTDKQEPLQYGVGFLFWGSFWSIIVAVLATQQGLLPAPQWGELNHVLVWLIPFIMLIVIPAAFATLFAPSQLNPGVVGFLFMTEISIGTASAAIFADEPFAAKEIIGVLLITFAGVSEPVKDWMSAKKPSSSTTH